MADIHAQLAQREAEHLAIQQEADAAAADYRQRLRDLNESMKPLREQIEAERLEAMAAEDAANAQPTITIDAEAGEV
jgi:hypothetical protein